MNNSLIYAGIGSRDTPVEILYIMAMIAQQMGKDGWTLRSGHAWGADAAFENGAISVNGKKQIFVPWYGFNHAPIDNPDYIRPKPTPELMEFSSKFHPNWRKCNDAAKLLHMRNACQILGLDGDAPASLVICWTREGKGGGGTGQALRIAKAYNIPIFDLGDPDEAVQTRLCDFVNSCEATVNAANAA